jgi:predicted LPLAT superfamily acyltransferase
MAKTSTPVWKDRAEKGSPFLIGLLAKASLFFGRRITRPVIYCVALFYVCCASAARGASRAYLTRVLNRTPSALEIYKHFLYFSSVTHDRLFLLAGGFDSFKITIHGQSEIDQALEKHNGVMLYGAHFGSFEAVRFTANNRPNLNISILMYEKNSEKLAKIFHQISPDLANIIIPLGSIQTMLTVRDRLSKEHMVGILADRSVNDEPGIQRDFLGTPATFPLAPFRLPKLFASPVCFIAGIYEGGNRYRIFFRDLNPENETHSTESVLSRYADTLEELCLVHPYNWFNFYDFWARNETT